MIWRCLGRLSAPVVLGVAVGLSLTGAWGFALNGRNIFDETYVSWCGDYVADDPTLFTRCRYGDARTVVARANYQW